MEHMRLVPALRHGARRAADALSRVGAAVYSAPIDDGGRVERARPDDAGGNEHEQGEAEAAVGAASKWPGRAPPQPLAASSEDGGAVTPPAAGSVATTSFGYFKRMLSDALAHRRMQPESADKPSAPTRQAQAAPSKLQRLTVARAAAERRASLERRTVELANRLLAVSKRRGKAVERERLGAVNELCAHFVAHPHTADMADELRLECVLLSGLGACADATGELAAAYRVALALVGECRPPNGRGIRLLSIDGGGTRGTMSLEILEALERHLAGRKLHDVFDMCVGVSTGAIICTLLAGYRLEVAECRRLYWEMSRRLFTQSRLSGVSGLLWSHSYYSTAEWIALLQEAMGQRLMVHTAKMPRSPKLCVVSCVVNTPKLEAFAFRNYTHRWSEAGSALPGSSTHAVWQAVQASAAAPGYFEEVHIDNLIHQDGGVLVNNPTLVGLHEARALWPNERIQCVLSIGNGRSMESTPQFDVSWTNAKGVQGGGHGGDAKQQSKGTGLTDKIVKIVDSATDTEMTHCNASTLLPSGQYYRLNPYMSHVYTLDEIDPAKLAMMRDDAEMYVRRNGAKVEHVAKLLLSGRTRRQRVLDWATKQALLRLNLSL